LDRRDNQLTEAAGAPGRPRRRIVFKDDSLMYRAADPEWLNGITFCGAVE
jgi:hypothetical protein